MKPFVMAAVVGCVSSLSFGQSYEFNGRSVKLQPFNPKRTFQKSVLEGQETIDDGFEEMPIRVDIRDTQTAVKDQGQRGSCAYFTATALIEFSLKEYFGDGRDINLSEEYLIYQNKAVDGYSSREDGSFLRSNLYSAVTGGLMLEENMPYTPSWFDKGMPCDDYKEDSPDAPSYCYSHHGPSPAQQLKILQPEEYDITVSPIRGSLGTVRSYLASGRPVTISIPLNQNGWDSSGEVVHDEELQKECEEKPDVCGGHTVLLVGYDHEKEKLFFKNSWGFEWGDAGYGSMSYSYFRKYTYAGGFFTARTNYVGKDLQNVPTSVSVENPTFSVINNVEKDGVSGVSVRLSFDYQAPVGSFYYVSLFPRLEPSSLGLMSLPISRFRERLMMEHSSM